MPVSITCRTLFSLSARILIDNSSVAASADLSVREMNLILSNASEALEISSRRNICVSRKFMQAHENSLYSGKKKQKLKEKNPRTILKLTFAFGKEAMIQNQDGNKTICVRHKLPQHRLENKREICC